ncbi:prolyl oligopeptidase-like protein [Corynespora cassiicola Philippines]|uniref:Prolyl oligopeptidase-like protein n=1 Tax=Corynespora cassiicola Philippines TaxID=1448308 RepID=A0A2T2NQS4_CORCC|nr:prolyl oligopeptidase-like protein [Corynespora cassiicola Philippines]
MHRFFVSDFFNFEFIRILSTARYGGCEIAEALEAAANIKDSDAESWSEEWQRQSLLAEALAKEARERGDYSAASSAFFRASNYARASQYMLYDYFRHSARIILLLERSKDLFKQGSTLMTGVTTHSLMIPYLEGIEMPAFLYLPNRILSAKNVGRHPLVINLCGGDSTQEEMFLVSAFAGVSRGFAVLTFEGPGQGILLKKSKLPMQPAFENVVSSVLDFLCKLDPCGKSQYNIDLGRISVVGQSLGAYFALRAAADSRIRACVAIDPPYDMWDIAVSRLPHWFLTGWVAGYITNYMFNSIVSLLSRLNFQLKWEVSHMLAMTGERDASGAFRALKKFTLGGAEDSRYLDKIKCPVFVSGAGSSLYFDPTKSSQKIYAELIHLETPKKELWIAEEAAQGGFQAKVGAFELANHRIFTWLEKQDQ